MLTSGLCLLRATPAESQRERRTSVPQPEDAGSAPAHTSPGVASSWACGWEPSPVHGVVQPSRGPGLTGSGLQATCPPRVSF